MLAIKLDKEIPCEYLCHSIQKLIDSHRNTIPNMDISNSVIVVDIKTIVDSDNSVPLLTHNPQP